MQRRYSETAADIYWNQIERSVSFVLASLYLQKYVKSRKMLKADNKLGKKKSAKYNTHQ